MNAQFDMMHCHDWLMVPALNVLKTIMDRKCIFTCHSTNTMRNGKMTFGTMTPKINGLEQDGIGYCDRVIGLSGHTCDEIKNSFSFDWDKLRCIPNGIDCEVYDGELWDPDAVRKQYQLHPGQFLIVYIGRLSFQRVSSIVMSGILFLMERQSFSPWGSTILEWPLMVAVGRVVCWSFFFSVRLPPV